MQQGTDEWKRARFGSVGASMIADVMAKGKTGEAATRKNLRAKLVAERMTGQSEDGFTSAAIQRGNDLEPIARAAYEIKSGNFVDQVGWIRHPDIAYTGCSPDGLVGDDGLVEIKCPNTATHIEYLKTRKPPREYLLQMQWQMEVTGRKWCDWVSFDDRMPEKLQLMIVRVNRDDEFLAEIRAEVSKFLDEVAQDIKELEAIAGE